MLKEQGYGRDAWLAQAAAEPESSEVPEGSLKFIDPMEAPETDRKMIYQGMLRIVVPEVEAAIKQVAQHADLVGGYVQQMGTDSVLIRVPSDEFDATMEKISEMGSVVRRKIWAVDVGEQYVDLELRIANLEKLAQTYRAMLEKASNVEETLQIQKELSRVTGELERLKGQLRSLSNKVRYATLEVQFQAQPEAPESLRVSLPFPWLRGLGIDELMGQY
jgi:DNA repair ATPase RecN